MIAWTVLFVILLTGCSSGARYAQAELRNADIQRAEYHVGDYNTGDRLQQQREKNRKDLLKDNPDGTILTDEDLPDDPQPNPEPQPDPTPNPEPQPDPTPNPEPQPDPEPKPEPEPQSTEDELYEQMVEAMYRAEYPIVLETDYETFCNLYLRLKDDPSVFWQRGYSCTYSSTQVSVYFLYTHTTAQEIQDSENHIQAAASCCLSGIPDGADDFTKALHIHDWLIANITYVSDGGWNDQTIYGALDQRECVCAGISQAFTYLCRLAGLEAGTVTGYASGTPVTTANPGGAHAWNRVVMDGSYYYVDVTWDNSDTTINGEEPIFYEWFGVLRDDIYPTHVPQEDWRMPQSDSDSNNYYREPR